jgi:hypothetical protein
VELSVKDRVVLLSTLAAVTGNLTELRILRELRENLSFSEEEHAALSIAEREGRLYWNTDADQPREVEIGNVARRLIVRRLKELNREGKLADDHLDVIDKFPEVEG